MTMLYNPDRKRIVFKWTEPVSFVMAKRQGVIDKVRTINVSVNKDGKLKSRDKKRHGEHPMFEYVSLFSDELRRINFFKGEQPKGSCEHCGSRRGVVPHFDMNTNEINWRCSDPIECRNNT